MLRRRLEAPWSGRRFEATYERPLLMLATLRASALEEGVSHPLWAAIAAEPPSRQAVNRASVLAALSPERHFMYSRFAQRAVQTNETSRAVAWLWPAHLLGADDGGRPLALVDLGASAGLNLIGDRAARDLDRRGGRALAGGAGARRAAAAGPGRAPARRRRRRRRGLAEGLHLAG